MSFFDEAYEGRPPWDIGRAQQSFVCLEEAGEIGGSVLDVGCGTGENVLFFAGHGHEAWGIDLVPTAIERAQEKARRQGIQATFRVADALQLEKLGRTFDTVTDSGMFHTLSDEDRVCFAESLGRVLRPGGTYYMLCFNEHQAGTFGPRRVTQREIREAFAGEGWEVQRIDPARFEANFGEAQAWLAIVARTGKASTAEARKAGKPEGVTLGDTPHR